MIDNQAGKVLKSYAIEGLIGTGAFGAVYRARQAVVEREVAIKIIWPAFANHPNFIRRFEAEAQLVAGLEHPHIVPLYDYWRDPDGAYIVMRLLRGGHLRGRMNKGQAWEIRDINRFLGQVGAALALAHRYGVVHRDIKPENILMDEEDNAYLADFGIAQIVSTARNEDDFSGMGSPAYAAPEQITGSIISSQSDIYSLGIILYELLTGSHPFPELEHLTGTQLVELRASTPLPSLLQKRPDLPPTLNDVVQKATALDTKKRYPDALSLAAAFQAASGQGTRSVVRLTTAEVAATLPNPYKGLRAFQEVDAQNFFGREALVRRLINRLKEPGEYTRFLAVVGPSGSGKSSVVKAGLLPALRQGALPDSHKWFFDEFSPGAQPFEELENTIIGLATNPPANLRRRLRTSANGLRDVLNEVLPQDGSELFLLIDQFEEVFTLVDDPQETSDFIAGLYNAVIAPDGRLRLVITIRADFYDRPLLQPRIADLVRERTEVIVPLSPQELESVIVEPARRVGVTIDTGLVAAIIAEVKEQPGSLPLLQYALSELFERREGALITPAAYRDLGGVRGALAQRAEELYQNLDTHEREAVRQLFLRLITLGEGTEDTRRRALLAEVTALYGGNTPTHDPHTMRRVIDFMGKSRLLTFDRDPATRSPTVEVAHEAIIREWGRLRGWLDDARNDVRMQRTLASLAADWETAGRDVGLLMRGIRLDNYERWAQTTTLALTESENRFIQTSLSEKQQREKEEKLRQERERLLEQRSVQRLRLLVGGLAVMVFGALLLTGFAFNERSRAEEARATSDASASISQSLALEAGARRALIEDDGDLAMTLALLANEIPGAPIQSQRTLAEVAFAPGTRRLISRQTTPDAHTAEIPGVAISPDSRYLASGSLDATVKIWDAASGSLIHTLTGHRGDVEVVAFAPDSRYLVSAATDFQAILWDVQTGAELRRFIGHTEPVRAAVFTPDGSQLITASSDTLLILWDIASGQEIRRFVGHQQPVQSAALSPDGSLLLSGARDGKLYLWDVATGTQLREFSGHGSSTIYDVAFSPDGTQAVSGAGDGSLFLWDVATGLQQNRFIGSSRADVRSVVFAPDGMTLYTAASDGAIHLWDVATALEINRLAGHRETVLGLDISKDGRLLLSGGNDQTLRLWNIGAPGAAEIMNTHTGRVSGLAYSADGRMLYSVSADGSLRGRDLTTMQEKVYYQNAGMTLQALALTADGAVAALGSRQGDLILLDMATGAELRRLTGHTDTIESLVFLANGQQLLAADDDGVIILWNAADGTEIRRFEGHEGAVYSLSLNREQTQFASGGRDDRAILWDLAAGTEIRRFEGHADSVYSVAISPDGTKLVTGSRDTFMIVWNIATGAEISRLNPNAGIVWSLSFAPDGSLLSGTADGAVIRWDITAYAELQRFDAGNFQIYSVRHCPVAGCQTAASGLEDGRIILWRILDAPALIQWARQNRYVRDLDCFEREQYRVALAECAEQ